MAGGILFSKELKPLLDSEIIFPPHFGNAERSAALKHISVDLTIGDIFIPDIQEDEIGGVNAPMIQTSLKQGQTAVIRTQEKLALPLGTSAICFPPSSGVSLPGLLTTNPGVIDPGFSGPLHLTVINMGKAEFALTRGDRILRVLFFKDPGISGGPDSPPPDPVTKKVMSRLSHDFLNVEKRADIVARSAIEDAELRVKWRTLYGPIIAGIIAALGGIASGFLTIDGKVGEVRESLTAKIHSIDEREAVLDAKINAQTNSTQISTLDSRIKKLENQLNEKKPDRNATK